MNNSNAQQMHAEAIKKAVNDAFQKKIPILISVIEDIIADPLYNIVPDEPTASQAFILLK